MLTRFNMIKDNLECSTCDSPVVELLKELGWRVKTTNTDTNVGKVHDKNSLFLYRKIGSSRSETNSYILNVNSNGSPLISCIETGKYFTINWDELTKLAEQAGVNKHE